MQDPRPLLEVGDDRPVAPVVAVDAHLAVAIEVVQQHVVAGQLVVVGRDVLAVHDECRIAVARRAALGILEIAEHLVVGAVLLDDVEHVLDGAFPARLVGNAAIAGHRGAADQLRRVGRVLPHLLRVAASARHRAARSLRSSLPASCRDDRTSRRMALCASPAAGNWLASGPLCRWPPAACGCRARRPGQSDTSLRE